MTHLTHRISPPFHDAHRDRAAPAAAQVRALRLLHLLPPRRPRAARAHHERGSVLVDPGQRRGRTGSLQHHVQATRHAPPHPQQLPGGGEPVRPARVHPAAPVSIFLFSHYIGTLTDVVFVLQSRLPVAVRRVPRAVRVFTLPRRRPVHPHQGLRPVPQPRAQDTRPGVHRRRQRPRRGKFII